MEQECNIMLDGLISKFTHENESRIKELAIAYKQVNQDKTKIIEEIKKIKNAEFEKLNFKVGDYFEFYAGGTTTLGKIENIIENSWGIEVVTIKYYGIVFHWRNSFGIHDRSECHFDASQLDLSIENFSLLKKITKDTFDKQIDLMAVEIKNLLK